MTPQMKFKVLNSKLDVVDLSQFLKDNMTGKLIGQHSFLGSASEPPSTIISKVCESDLLSKWCPQIRDFFHIGTTNSGSTIL
jgi:hypothetical protein